uniref:Sodium/nucleoside cotransporter n=1 Tax=Plectus sambesii TaxID=2011161 RepID=A0A914W1G9_9BILA
MAVNGAFMEESKQPAGYPTIEGRMANGRDDDETTGCMRYVQAAQNSLMDFWELHGRAVSIGVGLLIIVTLHIFLGLAIAYDFHTAVALLALMVATYLGLAYFFVIVPYLGKPIGTVWKPSQQGFIKLWNLPFFPLGVTVVVGALFIGWLILDTAGNRIRIVSLGGLFCYIGISVLVSANPARIKWRPVIWGLVLQFIMGVLVLKWQTGHNAFGWASDQVVFFLDYTQVGTRFTYGFIAAPPPICGMGAVFVYTALQVIIYFGAIVSVMYYLGVLQFVIVRIAWLMQYTMGTTAAESLNAAACIFLGQTEAALLVKPALATMTASEVHAVMTAGFACIAGSLFAAYISFGACPTYLLSATVMSAPASLAVAKIIYPEVEKSRQKGNVEFPKGEENNILECISTGACSATQYVWAIAANLIVFLALLAFLDAIIGLLGGMVGHDDLNFNTIVGYCFFPLAYVMGSSDRAGQAQIDETLKVAQLMGTKTVLNEFIAYSHLAVMIKEHTLSPRAQMIAIYALCGFSNISTIGSQLGILSSMEPSRKAVYAKVVVRALIAGSFACFMTACVAGILVDDPTSCHPSSTGFQCLDVSAVAVLINNITNTTPPNATFY